MTHDIDTTGRQAAPALLEAAIAVVASDVRCRVVAEAIRAHSIEVACLARELAPLVDAPRDEAFAAGVLHDIGELLLLARDPLAALELRALGLSHAEMLRRECAWFGTDHALLAAEHLLDLRVDDAVVAAVADHHDPLGSDPLTIVVAAADELLTGDAERRAVGLLDLPDDPSPLLP
jgi:putative nucleotidyltransferase with HDIG domain